jgi:exosome complex component RRP4
LSPRPPFVQVVPLSGRYVPKAGDQVVGTVTDVQSTFWLLDIGAPRWAPLHMTGTPWKVDVGETERYLRVGDAVVVRVENLEATGRIGVTMVGDGLGKLEGGTIVRISPARVPRVVGRGGSMIDTITRHTSAEVAIGQNGRVWIGGNAEAIQRVRDVLQMIEENGPRSGLTDRVERFLLATTPAGGPAGGSDVRVIPHEDGPPGEAGEAAGEEEPGEPGPDDE